MVEYVSPQQKGRHQSHWLFLFFSPSVPLAVSFFSSPPFKSYLWTSIVQWVVMHISYMIVCMHLPDIENDAFALALKTRRRGAEGRGYGCPRQSFALISPPIWSELHQQRDIVATFLVRVGSWFLSIPWAITKLEQRITDQKIPWCHTNWRATRIWAWLYFLTNHVSLPESGFDFL